MKHKEKAWPFYFDLSATRINCEIKSSYAIIVDTWMNVFDTGEERLASQEPNAVQDFHKYT
jgi:hypothetical protein